MKHRYTKDPETIDYTINGKPWAESGLFLKSLKTRAFKEKLTIDNELTTDYTKENNSPDRKSPTKKEIRFFEFQRFASIIEFPSYGYLYDNLKQIYTDEQGNKHIPKIIKGGDNLLKYIKKNIEFHVTYLVNTILSSYDFGKGKKVKSQIIIERIKNMWALEIAYMFQIHKLLEVNPLRTKISGSRFKDICDKRGKTYIDDILQYKDQIFERMVKGRSLKSNRKRKSTRPLFPTSGNISDGNEAIEEILEKEDRFKRSIIKGHIRAGNPQTQRKRIGGFDTFYF